MMRAPSLLVQSFIAFSSRVYPPQKQKLLNVVPARETHGWCM